MLAIYYTVKMLEMALLIIPNFMIRRLLSWKIRLMSTLKSHTAM